MIESLELQLNDAVQTKDKAQLKEKLDAIENLVTRRLLEQSADAAERQALTQFMSKVNDVRVRELGYPEWRHLLEGPGAI